MRIFDAYVAPVVQTFFQDNLDAQTALEDANDLVESASGIISFFETYAELRDLTEAVFLPTAVLEETDRAEHGDFQTNMDLAANIVGHLAKRSAQPEVIIEPTCGKGHFILASLQVFPMLEKVYGVEIYKPYVWETKFSVLQFFLHHENANRPQTIISHCDVFDFDFTSIVSENSGREILVIGNPPWVTNAMLGGLNSANLPSKSNFKKHSGLDAMTGKGNFDIAEYITLMMLEAFQNEEGQLALLIKNSVIKNIVHDQRKNNYRIGNLEKQRIDSKKEFNVSVDASLFLCRLGSAPSHRCVEFDFYQGSQPILSFGWTGEKFVSNIEAYAGSKHIDGSSPFVWRQGLKHDCSDVMELERANGHYVNALGEEAELEGDLVYGILKSSDLKGTVAKLPRKYTVVTQTKVGQDTSYIRSRYPKTHQYLVNHHDSFAARKSSIYKGKPSFSIFGIGDYSFKPFKVTISGLYKTFHFTLVLPENGKPVMLDDTCYMLSFDRLDYAVYTLVLLNSPETKRLLQSITFPDAKRTFTKDVLMRIDLYKLASQYSPNELKGKIEDLNREYSLGVSLDGWNSFFNQLKPIQSGQAALFS